MARLSKLRQTTERQQGTLGLDSAQVVALGGSGGGVTVYDSLNLLPVSDLTAGDEAYVKSNNRYYISNGDGWYNAALVNASPAWSTEPNASYNITDSATPLIITAKAVDSDNSDLNLINQSSGTDSAQYLVNITNDSSVFTFTPKSQDSVHASVTAGNLTDSNENDFIYTFKWSDGISFVSKAVTINYNFATYTQATGGTINTYSVGGIDYKSHTFLSGTTNFVVSQVGTDATIDLLIIGGGGGGGGGFNNDAAGGGGGAGAFLQTTGHTIQVQTYSMVVGNGGSGGDGSAANHTTRSNGTYYAQDGGNGGNSTAFGYTANGGGGGTCYYDIIGRANGNASAGGNGGAGGRHNSTSTTRASGGTYGNDGGLQNGTGQSNNSTACGGGGGAGQRGQDGVLNGSGGAGGNGTANAYRTGTNETRAGGGGGGHGGTGKTGASGGSGGGGNAGGDNSNGSNGTANTGSGGGGGSSNNTDVDGGSGGSGIIILRYVV